ncbi:MAG: hypothetical protein Q4E83_00275 [bacterium]|nr:hypothetical protein [bacterium]
MRIFFCIFIFCFVQLSTFAGDWNYYPYQTLSNQSYRTNYNRQINYKNVYYEQAKPNRIYVNSHNNFDSFNNYKYRSNPQRYYSGKSF